MGISPTHLAVNSDHFCSVRYVNTCVSQKSLVFKQACHQSVLHIDCIINSLVQLATRIDSYLPISFSELMNYLSSKERSDSSLSTDVDVNSLDLGVVLDSVFTEFSADTGLLESSEWNLRV